MSTRQIAGKENMVLAKEWYSLRFEKWTGIARNGTTWLSRGINPVCRHCDGLQCPDFFQLFSIAKSLLQQWRGRKKWQFAETVTLIRPNKHPDDIRWYWYGDQHNRDRSSLCGSLDEEITSDATVNFRRKSRLHQRQNPIALLVRRSRSTL
jgi:hypothetical protein